MSTLAEKVVALEEALDLARVPHAFGGALALAFHVEEPRATRDIDVNLFVHDSLAASTFASLPNGVAWSDQQVAAVEQNGQVRLFWDDTPIDVFFANHAFHDVAAMHIERVPFDGIMIPVLGATELAVFKAFFNRTRDWADIEAMIDVGTVDTHAALGWLTDLLGGDDERVERFRSATARATPPAEPNFGAIARDRTDRIE